jgi:hypothetical protein
MPDYVTPRWSPADLLDPVRQNLALLTPSGQHAWRTMWQSMDAQTPRWNWRLFAEATVDELALSAVRVLGPRGNSLAAIHREADQAVELYKRRGWLADPARYHRRVQRPTASLEPGANGWARLTYPSCYRPRSEEPGALRWQQNTRNRTVTVHIRQHRTPHPWVILLHGAYMGWKTIDARA